MQYLDRRCVTAETCTGHLRTKFEVSKKETLIPFDGVCSVRCPDGYNKVEDRCEKCDGGRCVKICEGGLVDSVGSARAMHGCTHIVNQPLIITIKRGGRKIYYRLIPILVYFNNYVMNRSSNGRSCVWTVINC